MPLCAIRDKYLQDLARVAPAEPLAEGVRGQADARLLRQCGHPIRDGARTPPAEVVQQITLGAAAGGQGSFLPGAAAFFSVASTSAHSFCHSARSDSGSFASAAASRTLAKSASSFQCASFF